MTVYFNGASTNSLTTWTEGVGLMKVLVTLALCLASMLLRSLCGKAIPMTRNLLPCHSVSSRRLSHSPGDKGLMGEKCTVLVPLTTFSDLLTEE